MKLSHLSIAILSAITLAACGGGGSSQSLTNTDSGTKPVDQTPTQSMGPTIAEQEVIVDPAQTGVVGKLDFKKESSVGTTQYIRNAKSEFDRTDNKTEKTSATSIFGVSVNKQNPHLTNIALARLKDSEHPNMTLVQYLGVDPDNTANFAKATSLQQQNKLNVVIPTTLTESNLAKNGSPGKYVDKQLANVKHLISVYQKDAAKLTAPQKETLKKLQGVQADLEALLSIINDKEGRKDVGTIAIVSKGSTANSNKWGDTLTTHSGALTVTDTALAVDNNDPQALGLVGINVKEDSRSSEKFRNSGARIYGTEENSASSTRIFGRNYSVDGNNKVITSNNSYEEARTVVLAGTNVTAYGKTNNGLDTFDSSSVANVQVADTKVEAATKVTEGAATIDRSSVNWALAVKPMTLEYVQYGRVTGNLDPVGFTDADIKAGEKFTYKRSAYLNKGDEAAVDTYFYRGPDATTLQQMNAVAAKGQTLVYRGHALMYGIDNEYHGNTSDAVPTAFGKTDMEGVGNFVEAKVDLGKGKLYEGFVYNVFHDKNARATVRDQLVEFSGNIYGNTVIGEAQRTYNKTDKADFRASFFGANADELGGSFNSTTYQERYGANGDVWGGVFGAKKVNAPVSSTISNQQLGDIPSK